jgi:NTE family protein
VLAGNPPAERLARLEALWQAISWPDPFPPFGSVAMRTWLNTLSNAQALAFGQPAFFSPRLPSPWLLPPGTAATESYYDTGPLRETLRRFVDFDRLAGRRPRLAVGATDIESGELVFFDNTRQRLGPEHVMASGSLPPGFPATEVDGRYYWDGGCVSNTPLEAVLRDTPPGHTVAFVIDLWGAAGPAPTTMNEVLWRAKQIQYASRTALHIDAVASKLNLRHAMRGGPEAQRLDIVHLIYHPAPDQIPASDAEFSRASIAERRGAGYGDMRRALDARPWAQAERPERLGCLVHRVSRGGVTTIAEPNLRATTDQAPPAPAVG